MRHTLYRLIVQVTVLGLLYPAFGALNNICEEYGGPYKCVDPDLDLPEGVFVGWNIPRHSLPQNHYCGFVDDVWKPAHNGVETHLAVTRHPSCNDSFILKILGPNTIGIDNCIYPHFKQNPNFAVDGCGYWPSLMARRIACSSGHLFVSDSNPSKAVCFIPDVQKKKNLEGCESIGNPTLPHLGIKIATENDFTYGSGFVLRRHYHSLGVAHHRSGRSFGFGAGWRHSF